MITDDESPYPPRIGYYLGTRILQDLRERHTWPELARWSTGKALAEVRTSLMHNG